MIDCHVPPHHLVCQQPESHICLYSRLVMWVTHLGQWRCACRRRVGRRRKTVRNDPVMLVWEVMWNQRKSERGTARCKTPPPAASAVTTHPASCTPQYRAAPSMTCPGDTVPLAGMAQGRTARTAFHSVSHPRDGFLSSFLPWYPPHVLVNRPRLPVLGGGGRDYGGMQCRSRCEGGRNTHCVEGTNKQRK